MVSLSKPSRAAFESKIKLGLAKLHASIRALAPRSGATAPGAARAREQQLAHGACARGSLLELLPRFTNKILTNWDPFVQYAVANAATGIRASRQAFPATAPGGLKVFVKSYLTDRAEASSRLIAEITREVTAQKLLAHPNVVPLLAVFVAGERLHLVFEYGGTPLDKFIQPGQAAKMHVNVAKLLRDLVPAVAAIHKAGLVHSDLKIQNIVFDPETCRHRIIDLGSCRPLGSAELPEYTACYVGPEVAAEIVAAVAAGAADKEQIMRSVAHLVGPLADSRALALAAAEMILGERFYGEMAAGATAAALPVPQGMDWEVSCFVAMTRAPHPWEAHEEWRDVPAALREAIESLGNGNPELRLSAERALELPLFAEAPAPVKSQAPQQPAAAALAAAAGATPESGCCDAVVIVVPAVLPAAKASPLATAAASVAAPVTAEAFEPAAACASAGDSRGTTDGASSGAPAAAAEAPQPRAKRSLLSRGLHRLNKRGNEACERLGRAVDGAALKLRACVSAPKVAM